MNPDGGRWRVMFVCNGQTPCPTLKAQEGDLVEIAVHSDSYFQSSIHWSGVGYRHTEAWNDGTAGLSQYPMLPRGNYTNVHDTTGAWGLSWYADHTTAASADGLYGMIYVAPDPARPRPYKLITDDPLELRQIMEAEQKVQHLALKNHMHRDTNWKLLKMRAEGSEFYCYDSLVVNGKGRNLCRPPGFEELNGQPLDESGCIQPPGFPPVSCTPSEADFEIIETDGQPYIMLNLVNVGFEHEVRVSIDHHKIFIVANDGGFVEPILGDVIYIPSASRLTILVKLDQAPGDYAMRISSTSQLQNIQGFALLRYPAKRQPVLGQPMQLPAVDESDICLQPDASVKDNCKLVDGEQTHPFPPSPPSRARNSRAEGAADFTFHLSAGEQESKTEKFAPEYFLNQKPWQLFRGALMPLLFTNFSSPSAQSALEKPVIHGLPMGSVVDLIIENQLNDSIPLYKHGKPAWLLGSQAHASFPHETVAEAATSSHASSLNLRNPPLVVVHDLPPLGWSVLRFEVTTQAATMLHAVKLRYFVLGMSAPILEGITAEDPIKVPTSAMNRPHIDFEPKNDGVFVEDTQNGAVETLAPKEPPCDEQKPECRNCVRHNVPCDFLESSNPSAPSPVPSGGLNGGLNMADLELLHHYTTYTYSTLVPDHIILRDYYRVNLVQMGFKHEYLMRTLLAISALHLAHHRKQSFDHYLSLATTHHEAAARTAMELMKDVTTENASMLFLFSSLTLYYALGAPRQKSNFLLVGESGFPDWMFLLRGSRLFHSYIKEDGELAPLLHDARQRWIRMFTARMPDDDPAKIHLDSIGQRIKQETTTAIEALPESTSTEEREATVTRLRQHQETYLKAISRLIQGFAGCRPEAASPGGGQGSGGSGEDGGIAMRMGFIWLFEETEGLLQLLQSDPTPQEAAVLLTFFAALLKKAPPQWWTQGWPEHLISRIYALLDENHRLWIRWPMEEMGWIPPP
ncbi:hypothetical protein E8E14_010796 [Neopestalotiopsis sp. 37M]|nr:hypothetical protein E8E14_010796 [Neopestalotiopsis sp. 37M]